MTSKTIDWLNRNRYRAYPFINDSGLVSDGSRVPDCVLLDCLVVDTRRLSSVPELMFTRFDVRNTETEIFFVYDGIESSYVISEGSGDDAGIVRISGVHGTDLSSEYVKFTIVTSSHERIKESAGVGSWDFRGKILPSKVVSIEASGVNGIYANGSASVNPSGVAKGSVLLEDGYRTQPVIQNGKILVKVGSEYGHDPCNYPYEEEDSATCSDLLLFFCGQNAINSGNIVIQGGPGIAVNNGSVYTAKEDILDTLGGIGIYKGEQVPCIEIKATSELLRIYRPSELEGRHSAEDSSGNSSSDKV